MPESDSRRREKLKKVQQANDDLMARIEKSKELTQTGTMEFKFISTNELFATNSFQKYKSKFS
jgi:hypothetical protein